MKPELDRRQLFTLGALSTGVVAASLAEPAFAQGADAPADGPSAGSAKWDMKAMPFPEKLKNTAAAGISPKTHEEHYKLYNGYVTKVNEIRKKLAQLGVPDEKAGNQTYSAIRELKVEYTFALGGVKNHEIYFNVLGGQGGKPTGEVGELIEKAFGSYERWAADLKQTGMAARGWVWLAHDYAEGTLFNYIGDAQNTFPVWHATPILALDVYEHAYYYDFQTGRAKYIDAFLKSVDWDAVNKYLAVAKAVAQAAHK